MAKNTQITNKAVNAMADVIARLADNGYLRLYNGGQPATANTAVTTQVLLSELRIPATSAPAAIDGVFTYNTITSAAVLQTGIASWFRVLESDGVTVIYDGSIGTTLSNMILAATNLQQGAQAGVSNFTYTAKKSAAGY